MTVGPGSKLGPYEVTGPLGAGGMGEVWRARDPRLGRDVAIKVLPATLAQDPERRARFERECRLLASLNHPHVASVLGLEDAGGAPALVMELVEGPTLADRIARDGAIPLDEALGLARQVAEAVEYAHERGIVHRDLKPGNVKLTNDGAVKVLDFGLAKALAPDETSTTSQQLTQSPTITLGTQAGILLGTAAYMAPEQARGKTVDRRADIWAFGVMLFEMLTGRQMFAGETVSDTIARILERQPDWGGLPARTPARVRELLRRCLDKDPRQRLRDIGDARLELEAAIAATASGVDDTPGAASRPRSRMLAVACVVIALSAVLGGWMLHGALHPRQAQNLRFAIVPPQDLVIRALNYSNDGTALYASGMPRGSATQSNRGIWRRDLDSFEWRKIAGTDGVQAWDESHDGRWIYVLKSVVEDSRQRELRRVPVDGSSPPATVLPWSDDYLSWDVFPDGRVAVVEHGVRRLAMLQPGMTGPAPWRPIRCDVPLAQLGLDATLADGRTILATASYYGSTGWTESCATLDAETGDLVVLEPNTSSPRLLGRDWLLMTRNGTVLASRWNARDRKLASRPVAVLEGLRTDESWSHAGLTASAAGGLGYVPGSVAARQRRLAIVHPDGRMEPWSDVQAAFERAPDRSPDGRFALVTDVPPGSSIYQVVLLDRGRSSTRRVAFAEAEDCRDAVVSPNGREVAYVRQGADSTDGLWLTQLDGSAAPRMIVAAPSISQGVDCPTWYPDGRSILFRSRNAEGRRILHRVTIGAGPATVSDVVRPSHDVDDGAISPDGTRIAYVSFESGEGRVVVATLGADGRAGDAVPVSRAEGLHPRWVDDTTLLWGTESRAVMGATVSPSLEVSEPAQRFDLSPWIRQPEAFCPLPDGSLLITRKAEGEDEVRQFDIVLDFSTELEAKVRKILGGGH